MVAKEQHAIMFSMDPYWLNRRFVKLDPPRSLLCCSWMRKDVLLNGVAGGVKGLLFLVWLACSFLLNRVVCAIASDHLNPIVSELSSVPLREGFR